MSGEAQVSVIMPVYNASAFLYEAIDSVLKQNFLDFEFIIINDGSVDDSEAIIQSFKDKRINYYYQENQGVASSLNKGLQIAKGKYIWRHDADDIALPDKLGKQVRFLEANPQYALCATQIAFMTEAGKVAYEFRQPKNNYFNDSSFVEVERNHFNPYSPITHATVLIRKDVAKGLGGFRTEFITAEDVDLWLRLIQQHKAAVLNDCNYFVRLNKASVTQVHGWKNGFFRNLAFQYHAQREKGGMDDLQKGIQIVSIPPENASRDADLLAGAKKQRENGLGFLYPLYLNAKDWPATLDVVKLSLADGWKSTMTWKLILFPLLGKNMVKKGVQLKGVLRKMGF